MPSTRCRLFALAATTSVLLAVTVACGSGDASTSGQTEPNDPAAEQSEPSLLPEAVQTLEIVGTDHQFAFMPGTTGLKPGWTEVTLRNDGAEAHQVMFARIKDDVDPAELAAAGPGDSSGAGAIEFVDMLGGVSYIGPGNEITALVDLPAGTVLAMCYVPDAQGVAHALHGMTATLAVDGPAQEPADSDVEVAGTIEFADDGYRFPSEMPAGWYHVVNSDTDDPATGLHEMALLELSEELDPTETEELVQALAVNETPSVELNAVGGMGAVTAGFDGYLYLDLAAAPHLAVDFMPDPGNPQPHMVEGYHATFTP